MRPARKLLGLLVLALLVLPSGVGHAVGPVFADGYMWVEDTDGAKYVCVAWWRDPLETKEPGGFVANRDEVIEQTLNPSEREGEYWQTNGCSARSWPRQCYACPWPADCAIVGDEQGVTPIEVCYDLTPRLP